MTERVPRRGGAALAIWLAAVLVALAGCTSGTPSAAPGTSTSASSPPSPATPSLNPDYGVNCLAVGAAVKPSHDPEPEFRQAQAQLGDLTIRRSFDSTLPSSFQSSAAAPDPTTGVHSFVSWKPPNGDHAGTAQGRYDQQITAWAKSVPRDGVYATAWHEPENDMTAADYVAFERHVYTVVKKANPAIKFGPVYMAYKWDPTLPSAYIGDPEAWWPGADYADFAGLDWYGRNPRPMTTSPSFTNWFSTVSPFGRPLFITEYGQYWQPGGQPTDQQKVQARAAAIRQDAQWIFAHPQIKGWLYWQSSDQAGSWKIDDPASQAAWRAVSARGCQP